MTQVLSFLQDKGGAGKTTNLLLIATRMAADGAKVAVIDTDELKSSYNFCKIGKHNISYVYVYASEHIRPAIKAYADDNYDIVLIDTPGFESTLGTIVIGNSDLIIIPSKADKLNVDKAVVTYSRIKNIAETFGKSIPSYLLFCDVDLNTNITKLMVDLIKKSKIPMLKTQIGHSTGFKELVTTAVLPKAGASKKHIEALICELQIKKLLNFYQKNNGGKK